MDIDNVFIGVSKNDIGEVFGFDIIDHKFKAFHVFLDLRDQGLNTVVLFLTATSLKDVLDLVVEVSYENSVMDDHVYVVDHF